MDKKSLIDLKTEFKKTVNKDYQDLKYFSESYFTKNELLRLFKDFKLIKMKS